MFRTAAALTLATTVAASSWEMTSVQGIATLMAVDGMEGDPDTFYGAAGINGKGSGLLESHDGGDKYDTDVPQGGMMDLGIAVSKDGETLCMSGMNTFVRGITIHFTLALIFPLTPLLHCRGLDCIRT